MSHPKIVNVYLNGIEIGSMPAADHKALQSKALREPYLYFRQLSNVILACCTMLGLVVIWLPRILIALGLTLLLVDPTGAGTLIQEALRVLQETSPAQIGQWLKHTIGGLMVGILVLVILPQAAWQRSNPLGLRDCFKDWVANELRYLFEAPAQGDIDVREAVSFAQTSPVTNQADRK